MCEHPCGNPTRCYLLHRTTVLLGPAREPAGNQDEVGFRVTQLPNGETIVTLTDTCDLDTVHALSQLIVEACLAGDPDIHFTRDPTEADTRRLAFDTTTAPSTGP